MSNRRIVVEDQVFSYRVGRTHVAIRATDRRGWNIPAREIKGLFPDQFERGRRKGTSDGAVTPGDIAAWIRTNVLGLPPRPTQSAPASAPDAASVEDSVPNTVPKWVYVLEGSRPDPNTVEGTQYGLIGVFDNPADAKTLQTTLNDRAVQAGIARLSEPGWLTDEERRRWRSHYRSDEEFVRDNRNYLFLWTFNVREVSVGSVLFDPFADADRE